MVATAARNPATIAGRSFVDLTSKPSRPGGAARGWSRGGGVAGGVVLTRYNVARHSGSGKKRTLRPGGRSVLFTNSDWDYGFRSMQPWKLGLLSSSTGIGKFTSVP